MKLVAEMEEQFRGHWFFCFFFLKDDYFLNLHRLCHLSFCDVTVTNAAVLIKSSDSCSCSQFAAVQFFFN